jgi:hypothetical protein
MSSVTQRGQSRRAEQSRNQTSGEAKLPRVHTSRQVCEVFQITPRTLTSWRAQGKIQFLRINSRTFRYFIEPLLRQLGK